MVANARVSDADTTENCLLDLLVIVLVRGSTDVLALDLLNLFPVISIHFIPINNRSTSLNKYNFSVFLYFVLDLLCVNDN